MPKVGFQSRMKAGERGHERQGGEGVLNLLFKFLARVVCQHGEGSTWRQTGELGEKEK